MIDDVDRALVHALHLDGRARFSHIAEVLGVSTQTVIRRYQRLRAGGALRVVGLADPRRPGAAMWVLRVTASPHGAGELAYALARRDDTRWVQLTSGGTEIFCGVSVPFEQGEPSLLLRDIPKAAGITSVTAQRVLHIYLGGVSFWRGGGVPLSEQQQAMLRTAPSRPSPDATLVDNDKTLLAALGRDGRATHTALAEATGWSTATVSRRLAELRASGALYFDVEIDFRLFGGTTRIMLWMTVNLGQLDQVAHTLSGHEEIMFLGATTGKSNLIASAMCGDPGELHHYLTRRLGAVDAIRSVETVPVLRTVKAFGPVGPATVPLRSTTYGRTAR
jgi:DNA-binding Lrp family transcriptional regulator